MNGIERLLSYIKELADELGLSHLIIEEGPEDDDYIFAKVGLWECYVSQFENENELFLEEALYEIANMPCADEIESANLKKESDPEKFWAIGDFLRLQKELKIRRPWKVNF